MAVCIAEADVNELSLDELRDAIRANLISFPSQVPCFNRIENMDIQWKIVQLYFVRG